MRLSGKPGNLPPAYYMLYVPPRNANTCTALSSSLVVRHYFDGINFIDRELMQ